MFGKLFFQLIELRPSTAMLLNENESDEWRGRYATETIDATSTGKLMEGALATVEQIDNDVRSERTRSGMKAALELGRWTFLAPLGYLNAPRSTGTSMIPDPE